MTLVFFSFVSKKELKHGYRGGGGHVFFAKLYLIFILYLFYIFIQKNPIFLYNFCQKWLDSLYKRCINDFSAHKTSLTMLSFYTQLVNWTVVYFCVGGIEFASFYDVSIVYWKYSDRVLFFSTKSYTIAFDLLLLWTLLPSNFKDENIF